MTKVLKVETGSSIPLMVLLTQKLDIVFDIGFKDKFCIVSFFSANKEKKLILIVMLTKGIMTTSFFNVEELYSHSDILMNPTPEVTSEKIFLKLLETTKSTPGFAEIPWLKDSFIIHFLPWEQMIQINNGKNIELLKNMMKDVNDIEEISVLSKDGLVTTNSLKKNNEFTN